MRRDWVSLENRGARSRVVFSCIDTVEALLPNNGEIHTDYNSAQKEHDP